MTSSAINRAIKLKNSFANLSSTHDDHTTTRKIEMQTQTAKEVPFQLCVRAPSHDFAKMLTHRRKLICAMPSNQNSSASEKRFFLQRKNAMTRGNRRE